MEIGMAVNDSQSLLVNKLAAIALIALGFLVLASSYRSESLFGMFGGGLLLAVGVVLLVLKIFRRNRPSHPG
jgi:hypothetical protein